MGMSLNSQRLDAFFVCAQVGNFTRAAERLHLTQSALSQRIKNLEEEIGATLFVREKKGVRLTETGERLVRYCQGKQAFETDLIAQLQNPGGKNLVGTLRVGAFSSVAHSLVMPALAKMLTRNPAVGLKLVVREVYELAPLLRTGEVDYLVTTDLKKREGMVTLPLGHEKNGLVQRRGYDGPDIYLDHDEEDSTTHDYFGPRQSAKLSRRYLDDIQGILAGVRLGLGRAILPLHLVGRERELELVNPQKILAVPVGLQYYEQPVYSRLHQETVAALAQIKEAWGG